MKVIDLLNKIANGEEVPKKVKYEDRVYEWKEYDVGYQKKKKVEWQKAWGYVAEVNKTYFYLEHCYKKLDDKIEIIEEKETKPSEEEIEEFKEQFNHVWNSIKIMCDKINELIDAINELRGKNEN